ncbi:putative transposase [Desulfofundulus luciae]|uniref:Transposase n=1 Tax=Desulfofundulus luciae TaxID=74702 RepID=A0ABU0AYU6_9FIRM|nr:putative transposase [Desulfofundulus luciae]
MRIIGISRSTYYYSLHRYSQPKNRACTGGRPGSRYTLTKDNTIISNEQVKEWICELVAGEGFTYGYLKLTYCLRKKFNLIINKKKVYRLCKELEVLRPQRKIKRKHARKLARNRLVTASNQLWEVDVKYGYIAGEDRFFFIMPIIDVYDRCIVDYHIGLSCEAKDAVITLRRALFKRQLLAVEGKPVIRSDNGPQFISNLFEETCLELNLEHERIPFKTPNLNAHIEAFHSILEEECLSRHEFSSYAEAYETVAKFIRFYNTVRINSATHYLAPAECYQLLKKNQLQLKPVKL